MTFQFACYRRRVVETTSPEITGFTQIWHPQAEIIRPELQNPRLQLHPAVYLFKWFGAFCAIH